MSADFRPRHYAKLILERPRERREELLARVPDIWRPMTETHIAIADEWEKHADIRNKKRTGQAASNKGYTVQADAGNGVDY